MLDAGPERDAVEAYRPSQHRPPKFKTAFDRSFESLLNEAISTTDSWGFTPSSSAFDMPDNFSDYDTRSIYLGHSDFLDNTQSFAQSPQKTEPVRPREGPPKQLQDYYDAAMQTKLMQEVLDDIHAERAEKIARRELLIRHDCTLIDQSEEESIRVWDEVISCAQEYLEEAQATLQTAFAAACEEFNVDVDDWQSFHRAEARDAWFTSAEGREGPKREYTASWVRPRNFYPYYNGIPSVGRHVDVSRWVFPPDDRPRTVRETRLPSTLNGREISAVPDVGAAANFIALRYVRSHGLTINSAARKVVKTAVGSAVDIMGTVTLPFSFKDEGKVHRLTFNVMREAVHDVIIGSPFLKLTKTYTRYKHRLQQMLREVRLPRLRFLGSHQYVRGWVNGAYVDAVPDTGADVPVMSLSFAREHGFEVIANPEHRILLEFADGSTATTVGMVRDMNWSFGSSEAQHHINVYVLEELQTDLILDNTFLYDTNAFVAHERDFWTTNGGTLGDGWMVSIIKLVGRVLKGSRWTNTG